MTTHRSFFERKTARQWMLALALACLPFLLQAQASNSYPKDIEEKIKQVENGLAGWFQAKDAGNWNLQERMAWYNLKGVSIAVIYRNQVQWAKGYGWADAAEKRAVTPQTLFQAASISKSVNAVGLLTLVRDKRIDLHTDINSYLVSWKFPYDSVSKGKKITLANLLSHSAGLGIHGFRGYSRTDTLPTLVQMLDGLKPSNTKAVRSQFEPGLRFQYSGGGTMISRAMAEDATGLPYEKFISRTVLEPLGMKNSFFNQTFTPAQLELMATAYDYDGSEIKGKFNIYPELSPDGLWTTPSDIGTFIIGVRNAYKGQQGAILPADLAKQMLTPYVSDHTGLGFGIEQKNGATYFGHSGQNEGFTSQYYGSLSGDVGVVVMVNSNNNRIIREIINSVASAYQWENFYTPEIKQVVKPFKDVLAKYAGTYKFDNDPDPITISIEKDGMVLDAGQGRWPLYFTSDKSFVLNEAPGSEQFFTTDAAGNTEGFTIKRGTVEIKAKKIK